MSGRRDASGTTVVAIDGPAGSGKSSVARALARRLGFQFLDTGAAYRSLAWLVSERGGSTEDESQVVAALDALPTLTLGAADAEARITIEGRDVTEVIRTEAVSAAVSGVARVAAVRVAVNVRFREIIRDAHPGIVVEGRDITTVVAPDADVRVLLTASEEVRVRRRFGEVGGDETAVGTQLSARDSADGQVAQFMTAADGVTVIDSTDMTFDETVGAVVRLVAEKRNSA